LSFTLTELLTRHALHPVTALIERGKAVSFETLAEESRRVAGANATKIQKHKLRDMAQQLVRG